MQTVNKVIFILRLDGKVDFANFLDDCATLSFSNVLNFLRAIFSTNDDDYDAK